MLTINKVKLAQHLIISALIATIISPPLTNLVITLVLITSLLSREIRVKLVFFFKSRLGITSMAFMLIVCSGVIYGSTEKTTALSFIWGWRKFLLFPISAAIFMNDEKATDNLVRIFWFACVTLVAYSFLSLIFQDFSYGRNPPGVIIRNSATQSLIFSIATIISIYYFSKSNIWNLEKLFSGLMVFIFILNISILTSSRSSYIALFPMIWVLFFLQYRNSPLKKKLYTSIITSLCVALILGVTPQSMGKISQARSELNSALVESQTTSIGARLTFWKNTIEMVPQQIFFGTGTGGFEDAYKKQVQNKSGAEALITNDPHNQYLKILIEHGVVGLIIFLYLLACMLSQIATHPSQIIGISVLSGYMLTSLFNSHFSTFNEGQFVWIFLGALLGSKVQTIKFWRA